MGQMEEYNWHLFKVNNYISLKNQHQMVEYPELNFGGKKKKQPLSP